MKYAITPKAPLDHGQFSIYAADEREALVIATRWLEHGCGVEIIGCSDGHAYDAKELERVLLEHETA